MSAFEKKLRRRAKLEKAGSVKSNARKEHKRERRNKAVSDWYWDVWKSWAKEAA